MSKELTQSPCEIAPYGYCNNAEGCDTCPHRKAFLEMLNENRKRNKSQTL